ncbi:MAG: helix-turn-helix domain-containing protein [Candidatus Obscuribacterales bacterium]
MAKILDRPTIPSEFEIVQARKSFEALKKDSSDSHFVLGSKTGKRVPITENAFNYVLTILSEMAKGHAVLVVPLQAELSTYEAAELLGVSRPFLIRLIDKGELPCRVVGRHRRVPCEDLLAYKKQTQSRRAKALSEMTAADDEMYGLGD